MSKIIVNNKEYEVRLNKYFIQPHLIINDVTTDVGIWDGTPKQEQDILLKQAAECYEHHKEMETIVNSDLHIHEFKKEKVAITPEHKESKKLWMLF